MRDSQPSTFNSQPTPWRGVFFDGPVSNSQPSTINSQLPQWVVYIGDEDAEPIGKVYTFHNYQWASDHAQGLARACNLELIDESMPD